MVGEEGGDKGVYIDNALAHGEALDKLLALTHAVHGFRERCLPDILQSDTGS